MGTGWRDCPLPPGDGREDSSSPGRASPRALPPLSCQGWHGIGMGLARAGAEGSQATDPAPQPKPQREGRKGGREGGESSITPPPQALIETINQTQKYYARARSEGEMVGCHGNPRVSIPMVGGGRGPLSWIFSRNV